MARVGEEFPLECPGCGGDIRLIAFITDPGPIWKILPHLGEPLEPPQISPARGPPTDWGSEAHESPISRKTFVDVPLAGLSLVAFHRSRGGLACRRKPVGNGSADGRTSRNTPRSLP